MTMIQFETILKALPFTKLGKGSYICDVYNIRVLFSDSGVTIHDMDNTLVFTGYNCYQKALDNLDMDCYLE